MLKFVKEYFSLSNNEQRGIIGLLLIILFVFGGSRMYFMFTAPKEILQDNTHLLALLEEKEQVNVEEATEAVTDGKIEIHYFKFDPNTASKEELLSLGFKENVASTLIKFRSKGGKFYQKEDLKKIYGVDERFYALLTNYISIPPKVYPKEQNNYERSPTPNQYPKARTSVATAVLLELNTTDSASLTFVKGIGPAFSSRIIKYRNLLGGFRNKEQLLEVYGITPEVFESIKDQVKIEAPITQLNVNQASWYELKNHPYINNELANILLNYKKAHGKIENFNFLLESKLISKEEFDKLIPYLSATL